MVRPGARHRAPSVWVLAAKSATLRSLGRFGDADRLLEPELQRQPPSVTLLVEQGWVFRDQGELTRSRQSFEAVRQHAINPRERAEGLYGLGWVAFDNEDFDQAEQRFREALAENPYADALLGLAWTLLRRAEPEGEAEAEKLCHEVLAEEPRSHMAHTCLGVLHAQQGDLRQAEHHLRRAIGIDPFKGSYVDLGALLVQMDRFEEAETMLEKAIQRNWHDRQAHIELGGLFLQCDFDGDQDGSNARRAAQHFRQALVIDPASGAAAIGRALALAKSPGDLVTAERVLRDALGRSDCDLPRWQVLVALARLLIERGDATQRRDLYVEALTVAQQAIELATNQADPYYVAGVAAYNVGEAGSEVQAKAVLPPPGTAIPAPLPAA
jgi:tetratricopeptide (TPR) repeat protein